MTLSREQIISAANEVFDQIQHGWSNWEMPSDCDTGWSHQDMLFAPMSHYKTLAKKLVTLIRGDPNSTWAEFLLMQYLPLIEESPLYRARLKSRKITHCKKISVTS